jgi:cellobiose phosphorylase
MQFGHFDDANREYVVTRPDTPRSWSNYLGSTTYGAIITNNAGGYSFYQSCARGRFTRLHYNNIPMDQPGRYFYVRDAASGDYWSTSWQPVGKPLDEYQSTCRHGTAYTTIESRYSGVASESTYFVPLDRLFECWVLKLTNETTGPRELDVFTYVEFTNTWDVQQDLHNLQFSQYLADGKLTGGRCINYGCKTNLTGEPPTAPAAGPTDYVFLGAVGAEVVGYETDREVFLGPYRTYANPLAVECGRCDGTEVHGGNGCGVLQFRVSLAPGESRELMVILGIGHAETVGAAALEEFDSVAKAREALARIREHWHAKIGSLVAKTPDDGFDSMVNVWNAYNSLITFAWSRAASLVYGGRRDGLGYRDTVQDILGVVAAIPDEARARLELMLTGQVSTGGAMPVIKPFEHRPGHESLPAEDEYRSDDCLWLFDTVPDYVKETGDLTFFDKVLPFADEGEATVLGHLRRAIEFNLARTGAHGLPVGLKADWNDCVKLGAKGESLFVAFQLRLALVKYAKIAGRLARAGEREWADGELAKLDAELADCAWDGGWFRRAFNADGTVIGTAAAEEGRIFLNTQSWAVISGAASGEQGLTAMDAVRENLATEYGIALLAPPVSSKSARYIGGGVYPPSMKENAGIFCHPQGWAVMAECILGRADRAWDYYRSYMPAAYNDRAEVRGIEPYVHCQSTHGKHSRRFGASRLPWLSGTATWSYYVATHYILGIRPDYDGLCIDPRLPSEWPSVQVTRRFRGAEYVIDMHRRDDGSTRVVVNGEELDGDLVPVPSAAGA